MAKTPPLKIERKTAPTNPNADEMLEAAAGKSDAKRLNVNVPPDLYARFKEKADREGHTLTWLVKRWLEEYVGGER